MLNGALCALSHFALITVQKVGAIILFFLLYKRESETQGGQGYRASNGRTQTFSLLVSFHAHGPVSVTFIIGTLLDSVKVILETNLFHCFSLLNLCPVATWGLKLFLVVAQQLGVLWTLGPMR